MFLAKFGLGWWKSATARTCISGLTYVISCRSSLASSVQFFRAGELDHEKEFISFDVPGREQLGVCRALLHRNWCRPGIWILCSASAAPARSGVLSAESWTRIRMGRRLL